MQIKSIAVLGYNFGMAPTDERYIIGHLCKYWTEQGIEVKFLKGTDRNVDADVVINHVDLTITPDDYIEFMEKFRYRINFRVRNISKNNYSQNMLKKNDSYSGKVILKTNANCGGKIDYFVEQIGKHGRPVINMQKQKQWRSKLFMDSYNYRLYNSIDDVPPEAWENDNLIVEKFLPEMTADNMYQVRYWLFCGDREFNIGVQSDKHVVKGPNIRNRYFIEGVPDILREYREKFGFDYGRFDYSIVDGKVNLFDMNRTPTIGASMQKLFGERYPAEIASGLFTVLREQG